MVWLPPARALSVPPRTLAQHKSSCGPLSVSPPDVFSEKKDLFIRYLLPLFPSNVSSRNNGNGGGLASTTAPAHPGAPTASGHPLPRSASPGAGRLPSLRSGQLPGKTIMGRVPILRSSPTRRWSKATVRRMHWGCRAGSPPPGRAWGVGVTGEEPACSPQGRRKRDPGSVLPTQRGPLENPTGPCLPCTPASGTVTRWPGPQHSCAELCCLCRNVMFLPRAPLICFKYLIH